MGDLPRRLGPAVLEERITEGQAAVVYRGRFADILGGAPVCVKVALDDVASRPGFKDAMREHARAALGVHHPHLVSLLTVGEEHGVPYHVLEWVEGATLKDVLASISRRDEWISVPCALTIACSLARALGHLHGARGADGALLGLVHGDISPSNVLLGRDGAIKLGDFALSRAAARATHEMTGKGVGKPGYLAPEIVQGEMSEPRSDQFCLGIVLWEMLAGQRLFSGAEQAEVLDRLVRGDIPPMNQLRGDVSAELGATLDVLLAVDPARRFPDLRIAHAQLFRELQRVAAEADDVDVAALLPAAPTGLDREEATVPNQRSLTLEASLPDWDAFSSSEVFAITAAPGRGPKDLSPVSLPVPTLPPPAAPPRAVTVSRTVSAASFPRVDRVEQWPAAPARTRAAPAARRTAPAWHVPAALGAGVMLAGLFGFGLAKWTALPPPPIVITVPATPPGAPQVVPQVAPPAPPPAVVPAAFAVEAPAPAQAAREAQPAARSEQRTQAGVESEDEAAGEASADASGADEARARDGIESAARAAPRVVDESPEATARVETLVKIAQQAFLRGDVAVARRVLRHAEKINHTHPDVIRLKALLTSKGADAAH
jgi:eukaryotic-like serine/threonine-protein kinase